MPRAKKAVSPPAGAKSAPAVPSRWKSLKKWQATFLDAWALERDRLKALAAAGKKVTDLEFALDTEQRFFDAYSEVQAELTVALEDAQLQSAMTGKNSGAQKLALEAFSARYAKKPNAAKRGGAHSQGRVSGVKNWSERSEKRWGAIFDSTRSEASSAAAADS